MSETRWVIWSNEHHLFWRPNSQGYTRDIEKAGRYTELEADEICHNPHLDDGDAPDEMKLPAPDAIESLQRRVATLEEELKGQIRTSEKAAELIRKLRDERDAMKAVHNENALLRSDFKVLTAENERLREALANLRDGDTVILPKDRIHAQAMLLVAQRFLSSPEGQDND